MYVICRSCNDTHRIWFSGRETYGPCTRCLVPCQKCRAGGTGAYCEYPKFPGDRFCVCECHEERKVDMSDISCRECMDEKQIWNEARAKYLKCGDCPMTNEEKLKIYKEVWDSLDFETYVEFLKENHFDFPIKNWENLSVLEPERINGSLVALHFYNDTPNGFSESFTLHVNMKVFYMTKEELVKKYQKDIDKAKEKKDLEEQSLYLRFKEEEYGNE